MSSRPVPSANDLRARLLARLHEIRHTLDQTVAATSLSDAQRADYQRLIAALERLEQRIHQILSE
jgi:hypothetical protein